MSKGFWFNGKGNVTLSISILATIILTSFALGRKMERVEARLVSIEDSTRQCWTIPHHKVWVSLAKLDEANVVRAIEIVGER